MAEGWSIKTLRAWLIASALFFLLTGGGFVYLCFDGASDGLTLLSIGCAFTAAGLNTWNFRMQLRRKRSAERGMPKTPSRNA